MKDFLGRIPTAQTPTKVTTEYLEAAGFRSKNDRAIIPILKFAGLLSDDGRPTESYTLMRDKNQSGAVLASLIKKSYSELFDMYSDANNQSNQALKNFFSTKTTGAEPVVNQIVATFKTLCETADFGAGATVTSEPEEKPGEATIYRVQQHASSQESGVTINLNIQLQLPPTEDASIYDKIFESLKKHLIERKPAADA